VEAIRAFGERSDRVLQYSETGAGGEPLSLAWFEHWRAEILRLSRRRPLTVGVFQNQGLEEVTDLVRSSGVDLVQLHGDEDVDFAASLSRATGVPCIKVLHVPHDCTADAAGVERVVGAALRPGKLGGGPVGILLDTSVGASRGGSGQRFDLSVAHAVQQRGFPVVVAGGLSAENVEGVVRAAKPFGVDVSGGVEASPGVKDHAKLADFLSRVRALGALEGDA
jgi:phosphoribosylanthranilate isomerase